MFDPYNEKSRMCHSHCQSLVLRGRADATSHRMNTQENNKHIVHDRPALSSLSVVIKLLNKDRDIKDGYKALSKIECETTPLIALVSRGPPK